MSLARDTLITFTTRVGLWLVLGARSILTARVLLPAGKGALGVILLVPTFLQTLGEMGVSMANVYMIGRRRARPSAAVGNSLIISAAVAVLFLGAYIAAAHAGLLDYFLKGSPRWPVHLAAATLPFAMFTQYAASILQAKRRLDLYNIAQASGQVLFFVGLLVVLLGMNGGVGECVVVFFAAALAAFLTAIFLLFAKQHTGISFDWGLLRHSLAFGIRGHPGSILEFLNLRLDIFLVSYYLDFSHVGYYVVAVALAETVWFFPRSLVAALFPRLSEAEDDASSAIAARAIRNGFAISIVLAALLFAIHTPLVRLLFGPAYIPSSQALTLLLPGVALASLGWLLKSYIVARGAPLTASLSSLIALTLNILLNILLIPRLGIRGAALASTASYSLQTIFLFLIYTRLSRLHPAQTLIIRPSDLTYYRHALHTLLRR